jgi:hypothetical protein
MIGKITVSVAAGVMLFSATVRLPATPCFVTNTPSEKACQPDCCANEACCATSYQRTGSPVQPLSKSNTDQAFATIPAITSVAFLVREAIQSNVGSSEACSAYSPPTLALICIRLI